MIDVIAPGVDILSTWIGPNNTETESISGTSMGMSFLLTDSRSTWMLKPYSLPSCRGNHLEHP